MLGTVIFSFNPQSFEQFTFLFKKIFDRFLSMCDLLGRFWGLIIFGFKLPAFITSLVGLATQLEQDILCLATDSLLRLLFYRPFWKSRFLSRGLLGEACIYTILSLRVLHAVGRALNSKRDPHLLLNFALSIYFWLLASQRWSRPLPRHRYICYCVGIFTFLLTTFHLM